MLLCFHICFHVASEVQAVTEMFEVAQVLAEICSALFDISWAWVRGHSRNTFNELADAAAKRGASGTFAMGSLP